MAQQVKNVPTMLKTGDVGSVPRSGRSPGGGKWQPTPVLPGESHRQELGGLQSKGSQSWTQMSD